MDTLLELSARYDAVLGAAVENYGERQVRVPKGALVRSTHPHSPLGWHPSGRGQVVTVAQVSLDNELEPVLSWAGSAGYWKDVRAQDAELV